MDSNNRKNDVKGSSLSYLKTRHVLEEVWQFEKGVYTPPPFNRGLRKRQINVSEYIRTHKIGALIGKGGKNFYKLTEDHNLLYIFYTEGKIELFGYDDREIMEAVKKIIKRIKYFNYLFRTSKQNGKQNSIEDEQVLDDV